LCLRRSVEGEEKGEDLIHVDHGKVHVKFLEGVNGGDPVKPLNGVVMVLRV
jgi:hypothetical protein